MNISITIIYGQIILIFLLTFSGLIAGKAIRKYRQPKNFMNPEREEITDEMIRQQVKTLGKVWKKLLPEHRKPVAYVLEILRRDINYQLGITAAERKALKDARL